MGKEIYLKISEVNQQIHFQSVEIDKIKPTNDIEKLKFWYKEIGCSCVDIVRLSDKLDLIIDEEGLFVSENPAFVLATITTSAQTFVGTLLIGKRIIVNGSDYTVGFDSLEELFESLDKALLHIALVGRVS